MRLHELLESQVTEMVRKVNGKWALVSTTKPHKVLQYYHGSEYPSKEWIDSAEQRVRFWAHKK